MISAERLSGLITMYAKADDRSPFNYEGDTATALRELEAARARIAELERLLMGLSREDREACISGADSLLVESTKWERRHYVTGLKADKLTHEKIEAQAAILRRLGGQTT